MKTIYYTTEKNGHSGTFLLKLYSIDNNIPKLLYDEWHDGRVVMKKDLEMAAVSGKIQGEINFVSL